jgi:hypothetical protein
METAASFEVRNAPSSYPTEIFPPRETDLREFWECRAAAPLAKAYVDITAWN